MAVVLNEIFFLKFDQFTNSLLSAFTFCSNFALNQIGVLLFGYIGFAGVVGMPVSLMVAQVVLVLDINWRVIFWIGATIALIGSAARLTLS